MNLVKTLPIMLSLLAPLAVNAQIAGSASAAHAPLGLEQVLSNLEQRNSERAAALEQFEGTRTYRMEYRGFPGDKQAEMVVKVTFRAPSSKAFTVVSQTGSPFVIDHVFRKLLDSEREAMKAENLNDMALTRQNYDFQLIDYQVAPEGPQYVLKIQPKTKNRFLYRGKIWVDAKDFAVVRIEGEPGKNPSMWIKKTDITHRYAKVDDFWLPVENHTESYTRLGGKATLSIEYENYRIIKSVTLDAARKRRGNRERSLSGASDASNILITRIAPSGTP